MAESDAGLALIVVGIVLLVLGIFFFGIFFWPFCGLGVVLIIVGIVLVATAQSQPAYYYPMPSMPAPPVAPPAAGAPAAPFSVPACPVCGSPLMWVPQYGRWYCTRCQAYR